MKKFLLAAAAVSALCASQSFAGDDSGWYLRGNAGVGAHTDADFDQSILRGDIESKANLAGSLGVGYEFDNNWRVELDGDSLWTDMGQVGNNPGSYAKLRTNSAMINAIYDFEDYGKFEPFVGAGIGLVQGSLKAEAHDFINGAGANTINPSCLGGQSGTCTVSDKATGIGWQLLAGLGYKMTDNLTWDTHYSYMSTGNSPMKFDGNFTPNLSMLGPLSHPTKLNDVGAHTLMTGLRYKFGKPAPKPTVTCWNGDIESSFANCAERPTPKPVTYSCWDGSVVADRGACPVKPEPRVTCWDGSTALNQTSCPSRPAPKPQASTCWDGSLVYDLATCPAVPAPVVQSYNNCGPSNVAIFNVPVSQAPKQMSRLGTMPEFGDSHGLSPNQFFEKLQNRYAANKTDKAYLNYLFKSMGYSNGFADAQSYMFSEEVLPVGTRGMLGLGAQHHYKYSILPSTDRDRQAFRIQSANGSVVHFMKTCGNYMYACN